ncbi:phosphatidylglycerophosphate synthase [Lactobacillus colini]|uniref:Phosphatidylglycerophosphate synthase n=1 Tax=Lactobacillus colini TaxID=1819254 RepID=A0ABS4MER3_9LACO|nr:cytochrome C5 [Lactobacillus colini]MBP2058178.1 phosphatidylglycerophosphate synthase [Lactobacillus colini]
MESKGSEKRRLTREEYRQKVEKNSKLNVWDLCLDRPYVSVAFIILAIFFIMIKWWLGLLILGVAFIISILTIAHSRNPEKTLSIEFRLGGSRILNLLKAIQIGASLLLFLATYMRQVVSINFQTAGSQDALNLLQGAAASTNNAYAAEGANAVGVLNNLLGGSLLGTYRYAASSAQFMNDSGGRAIMIWIFFLMLAPAICVLAQFFREPYSRRALLVGSGSSMVLFALTPILIRHWAGVYAVNHQISQAQINQAFSVGYMAYIAIICSIVVFVIAVYRSIKQDNFSE